MLPFQTGSTSWFMGTSNGTAGSPLAVKTQLRTQAADSPQLLAELQCWGVVVFPLWVQLYWPCNNSLSIRVAQFPGAVLPFSNKRDNLAKALQEEGSLCTQNVWSDHPHGWHPFHFTVAVRPPEPPGCWVDSSHDDFEELSWVKWHSLGSEYTKFAPQRQMPVGL